MLRIVAAEDLVGSDQVRVDVQVRYWRFEYRNRANLCLLRREEGAHGLGIYVRWMLAMFALADELAEHHYHSLIDRHSKVAQHTYQRAPSLRCHRSHPCFQALSLALALP